MPAGCGGQEAQEWGEEGRAERSPGRRVAPALGCRHSGCRSEAEGLLRLLSVDRDLLTAAVLGERIERIKSSERPNETLLLRDAPRHRVRPEPVPRLLHAG